MKYVYLGLGWVLGLGLIIPGVMVFLMPPSLTFSGLLLLAMGLVIFPPFRNFLSAKLNINLTATVTVVALVSLFIATKVAVGFEAKNDPAQKALEAQQARQEQIEAHRSSVISELNRDRETVVGEIQSLIERSEYSAAVRASQKYLITDDPELEQLNKLAQDELERVEKEKHTQVVLEKLNSVPDTSYEKKLSLYRELVALNPKEYDYQIEEAFYAGKVAELERVEHEAQAQKDRVVSQFSAWDGSHYNLEKLIKQKMHDPDSYEHVKTTYRDMRNQLVVKMDFRGANAFGGKVLNSVTAKVSMSGEILEIIE